MFFVSVSCRKTLQSLSDAVEEKETEVKHARARHVKFLTALGVLICVSLLAGIDGVVLVCSGASAVFLLSRFARKVARKENSGTETQINFSLPLIVEEILMAVRSGRDVYGAIRIVVEHSDLNGEVPDPVRVILRRVLDEVEQGLTVERALRLEASRTTNTSLKHSLLHLAVAHREGAGLVYALAELADATQSFYEDTVSEQIAKLPAKATLPLIITFAGVLILFMTPPLLDVLSRTLQPVGMP